jgi:hypothetical protein
MIEIAHIVNPVVVGESSDLYIAQPITFETMRLAQSFAQGQGDVTLFTAQYPEDHPMVPEGFHITPDLERSVLDLGAFEHKRKLPLIKDVLDRLYEATTADYLVYTNVDIALQPCFYLAVSRLIDLGFDALVITRRSITPTYQRLQDIPLMFGEIGERHPGFDCFVFKRSVYPDYFLASACIGAGRVGKVLLLNLIVHATKFGLFKGLHLTFHLGDERVWRSSHEAYLLHNERELRKVLKHYEAEKILSGYPTFKPHIDQMKKGQFDVHQEERPALERAARKLLARFGLEVRRVKGDGLYEGLVWHSGPWRASGAGGRADTARLGDQVD